MKARVDEPLDAISVEASKAARNMSKAEHRIAPNHRIAVARESHTTVLRKLAIATFARKFENPIRQLNRVIPLEHSLRNPGPVQLQAPYLPITRNRLREQPREPANEFNSETRPRTPPSLWAPIGSFQITSQCLRGLELSRPRNAWKWNHVSDIRHARHELNDALETQAETGMRCRPVTAQIEIPPIRGFIEPLIDHAAL